MGVKNYKSNLRKCMNDIVFINFKVIYKDIETDITMEGFYDAIHQGIDIFSYLEEMYKKSTVYLRDKKLNELLSK